MYLCNYVTIWDRVLEKFSPDAVMEEWWEAAEPEGGVFQNTQMAISDCENDVIEFLTKGHAVWSGMIDPAFDDTQLTWVEKPGGIHFELYYKGRKIAHLICHEIIH